MGGIFIHHRSAVETINGLNKVINDSNNICRGNNDFVEDSNDVRRSNDSNNNYEKDGINNNNNNDNTNDDGHDKNGIVKKRKRKRIKLRNESDDNCNRKRVNPEIHCEMDTDKHRQNFYEIDNEENNEITDKINNKKGNKIDHTRDNEKNYGKNDEINEEENIEINTKEIDENIENSEIETYLINIENFINTLKCIIFIIKFRLNWNDKRNFFYAEKELKNIFQTEISIITAAFSFLFFFLNWKILFTDEEIKIKLIVKLELIFPNLFFGSWVKILEEKIENAVESEEAFYWLKLIYLDYNLSFSRRIFVFDDVLVYVENLKKNDVNSYLNIDDDNNSDDEENNVDHHDDNNNNDNDSNLKNCSNKINENMNKIQMSGVQIFQTLSHLRKFEQNSMWYEKVKQEVSKVKK